MSNYHKLRESKYAEKFEERLEQLPSYCDDFFKSKSTGLLASSMESYAIDLKIFFRYVLNNILDVSAEEIKDITLDDMSKIKDTDIGDFLYYVRYHTVTDPEGNYIEASKATVEHKSISVCALFKYLKQTKRLSENPTELIGHRTIKKTKSVIYMDDKQQERLLRCIETGIGLSKGMLKFWNINKIRDLAIITVFLDTGIRVSELVGLDVNDIDMYNHKLYLTRKGEKDGWVPLSDNAEEKLQRYLTIREMQYRPNETDTALFLSLRHNRVSIRNVQDMVEKYVEVSVPEQAGKVSAHKLRSSYAMNALKATTDILLVSKNLGHSSLETTKVYVEASDSYRLERRNDTHIT